jgi:hypothetical protein
LKIVRILTPIGVLDPAKQVGMVEGPTDIIASAAADTWAAEPRDFRGAVPHWR